MYLAVVAVGLVAQQGDGHGNVLRLFIQHGDDDLYLSRAVLERHRLLAVLAAVVAGDLEVGIIQRYIGNRTVRPLGRQRKAGQIQGIADIVLVFDFASDNKLVGNGLLAENRPGRTLNPVAEAGFRTVEQCNNGFICQVFLRDTLYQFICIFTYRVISAIITTSSIKTENIRDFNCGIHIASVAVCFVFGTGINDSDLANALSRTAIFAIIVVADPIILIQRLHIANDTANKFPFASGRDRTVEYIIDYITSTIAPRLYDTGFTTGDTADFISTCNAAADKTIADCCQRRVRCRPCIISRTQNAADIIASSDDSTGKRAVLNLE